METSPTPQDNPGSKNPPFKKEPFNAGVEADEEQDPKKFIEQLTGKLGQSLRKYNDQQSQPDFKLEKFAINSVISASHTSEMDEKDQNDIINKIKKSGDDSNPEPDNNPDKSDDSNANNNPNFEDSKEPDSNDFGDNDENLAESSNMFVKPKKLSIFAPKGSEESKFKHSIKTKLKESFSDNMNTPTIEPKIKPVTEPVKPLRKNKPFQPKIHPGIKPKPKAIEEVKKPKNELETYFTSFSSAVGAAKRYAEANGYTVDDNDWWNEISVGQGKPDNGKTNKYHIPLYKDGLPSKKMLHIAVYGMEFSYELTCYIN